MTAIPRGAVGIYGAIRTPFVPAGGAGAKARPEELVARLARALLDPVGAREKLGALVVGCAFPEGVSGGNVARAAAHTAGLSAAGVVVSSLGASGLSAALYAALRVLGGEGACLAAGVELPSRVPYGGQSPESAASYELLQRHGQWPRHLAARAFAEARGVGPGALDEYSSRRDPPRVRRIEALGAEEDQAAAPLPSPGVAAFEATPRLVWGEAGGAPFTRAHAAISADGAAALLFGSDPALGRPLAYLRAFAAAGAPGRLAPDALIPAVAEALYRGGVSAEEVGRFFVSDDFAAVPVGLGRALGRPLAQLYGGALASGYAAGADGIRLLGELSLSLASGEARFGLAASWAEGGGAEALLLEAA